MNIFVGNLSFEAKDADVYKLFMGFGKVTYVSIVMDKKGTKSRGFGFLEMPSEQQAQAAIAALNAKEFMGRTLNVEPARPKPEVNRESRKKEKMRPDFKTETQHYAPDDKRENQVKPRFNPVFKRTGGYRGGRRTISFMKRRAQAGIEEPYIPRRKNQENPMRWRKKQEQPKPWQKKREESKPGEKTGIKSKPRQKSSNRKKQFRFKGRKRPG